MNQGRRDVLAVIMGGGAGVRLFPLTRERAKPAVPLGGKYRLVDVPISNCLNSGIRRIFLLTQFNSTSLHRHVQQTYHFDPFMGGFVQILAAQQTPLNEEWYQGTADAVRQNLRHICHWRTPYTLILSGDQLYRMDFRELLALHEDRNADVTIAVHPVDRAVAPSLGLVRIDATRRIVGFEEKPQDPDVIDSVRADHEVLKAAGAQEGRMWLASMGIYLFRTEVLLEALENDLADFGQHVIPSALGKHRLYAHVFSGYWEDIGTIGSFYEANLDLTSPLPRFDFYNAESPIYTRPRSLPAAKMTGAAVQQCIIAEGCIIMGGAELSRSIVGIRSIIGAQTRISDSIIMGNDFYARGDQDPGHGEGEPGLGIGAQCRIERSIVDKNVRIGNHVTIRPEGLPDPYDGRLCHVRDGVVIVPKGTVIPHGAEVR